MEEEPLDGVGGTVLICPEDEYPADAVTELTSGWTDEASAGFRRVEVVATVV